MSLRLLLPFGSLVALLVLGSACTAELDEGCLGGPCTSPDAVPVPPPFVAGSSSGQGGAGGGSLSCETTPATGDFPCDVFTVLQNNCHSCHQNPPLFNAPFSLLTYEDTRGPVSMSTTTTIWERIGVVVASGEMPLGGTMTAEDKQVLLDWVAACAAPAESTGCE